MLKNIKYFCLLSLYFLLVSCNTTEPKISDIINLNALDASCTEAWLQLKTQNLTYPAEITLTRNEKFIKKVILQSADTVIYDESLLPSRTYNYQASIPSAISQSNNQSILSSNIVSVTTMDTTSHNFTWQTYTFGGTGGSSYLKDVAIIDENNIWAVGEIYENGKDYNAVHWDGERWELKRIMFYIDQDQPSEGKTSSPCQTCFVFNNNELEISSRGQVAIFNTNGEYSIIKMGFAWEDRFTINALWGVSSSDFYVIGNSGNIAHYRNGVWRKIESGTDVNLTDIEGTADGKYVWACGWENNGSKIILEIKDNNSKTLWDGKSYLTYFGQELDAIWYDGFKVWFAGGTFVHKVPFANVWKEEHLSNGGLILRDQIIGFIYDLTGSGQNEVIGVGEYGVIWIYNGVRWKFDDSVFEENGIRRLYAVDKFKNTTISCGWNGSRAWILVSN